jgi:uncharacterized repeat protein (TIGR03803 family)
MKKRNFVEIVSANLTIVTFLLFFLGQGFNVNAQTVTLLYSFGSSANDGSNPYNAELIQGSDGNFYGTTGNGGPNNHGTVFRISASGIYTTLYYFAAIPDGQNPHAPLVQGSDGNFYGTTAYGGSSGACGGGCGTVFRISASGVYTSLHSFVHSPAEGSQPAGLVQASDGNFYGTTGYGGTNDDGTVFQITPSGLYETLYSFPARSSPAVLPFGKLVAGSDGNLYGTTEGGGLVGTVFRINPDSTYTNLHMFTGSSGSPRDGDSPYAGLAPGADGNFYGTTANGGAYTNYPPFYDGPGTIFRISPSGTYTSLFSFGGPGTIGTRPFAPLVQGSDGNFYGTTADGAGTLFRITPGGAFTNLHTFAGSPNDGSVPNALLQGSDGNFYGTTQGGGAHNVGTVFKLEVPLNPPANQISTVQIAGSNQSVSVPSVAHETYQLQFTTDLTSDSWTNIPGASVTNSVGALLTLTNVGGAIAPQGFYRFDITP